MKQQSYAFYDRRRKELLERVKQQYPEKQGSIMLLAGFEDGKHSFRQDSSFYYYTGLTEPGLVLIIEFSGKTQLFIPAYATPRGDWLVENVVATPECAQRLSMSDVRYLGTPQRGYEPHLFAEQAHYHELVTYLTQLFGRDGVLVTYSDMLAKNVLYPAFLQQLMQWVPLREHIRDIQLCVAHQRSVKNKFEIETLYKAVEVTMVAQQAAAQVIKPGVKESLVKAGIEYIFAEGDATPAFPSIVAAGKNSTVLHYHDVSATIKPNDLVVVDIGAEVDYYCADITRTYPASGKFTQRQKQIYDIVLSAQYHIASKAKPGMYIRNAEKPELSLQHIAIKFLESKGYAKYFKHGIGHYLGIDVHDVGDYTKPLEEGNVITIEPGIYIPEENIGIRIEDDYWVVKDGVQCLSEDLPKDAESIEEMAQTSVEDSDEDDYVEDEY